MNQDNNQNVVIIDYKLGNLYSVKQACESVGILPKISSFKEDLLNADALILPGVGAFIEAMNNLKKMELDSAIISKVKNGTPFFGICLGLQLLFTKSEEFGTQYGLDLVPGVIKKFPNVFNERKIRIPHISWNTILKARQEWVNSPLRTLESEDFMYFVHSYYAQPSDQSSVLSVTNYEGMEFCSSIMYKNIFATQFHPEKSSEKGIEVYKNWGLSNNLI